MSDDDEGCEVQVEPLSRTDIHKYVYVRRVAPACYRAQCRECRNDCMMRACIAKEPSWHGAETPFFKSAEDEAKRHYKYWHSHNPLVKSAAKR